MNETNLRRAVIDAALELNRSGINQGTSGNVSARSERGFLVTPTGMDYHRLEDADIVELDLDGRVVEGRRLPSSEWAIHASIYASRPDAMAVVHAHPRYCTAVACTGREIPAFHYMVAVAGGSNIRCSPYATFGTAELATHALEALRDRKACLLGNHGMLALGGSLEEAMKIAVEVETLAAQYWHALLVGPPRLLDEAEMQRVIEKFRTYGKQK